MLAFKMTLSTDLCEHMKSALSVVSFSIYNTNGVKRMHIIE